MHKQKPNGLKMADALYSQPPEKIEIGNIEHIETINFNDADFERISEKLDRIIQLLTPKKEQNEI